jgi:hypothetical protein
MWPAALSYVLSNELQRDVFDPDRHSRRVVRKRRARRSRSASRDDS